MGVEVETDDLCKLICNLSTPSGGLGWFLEMVDRAQGKQGMLGLFVALMSN